MNSQSIKIDILNRCLEGPESPYKGALKAMDEYAKPLVDALKEIEDAIINPHTSINQTLNQIAKIVSAKLASYTSTEGEQEKTIKAI